MINNERDGVSTGSTGVGGGSAGVVRELCVAVDPVTLAGSLLAAPPGERAAYAAELAAAGAWVHVDVIDETYPLGVGVSPDLLAELANLRDRIEVHLLVADPVRELAAVLAHRPARVTIQVEDLPVPRGPQLESAARVCAEVGTELWVGIAPDSPTDVLDEVRGSAAGVLVMLAEPGRAGTVAEPAMVRRAAELHDLLCGVDGGVTEEVFAELGRAGVNHIVMGRRLWALASAPNDIRSTPSDLGVGGQHSGEKRSR